MNAEEDADSRKGAPSLRSRPGLLLGLLLVLLVFAVFQRVPTHDFVGGDDTINVFENPHFRPLTWQGVAHFWRRPYFCLYMPLTYTVWAGAARLAMLDAPTARLSGGVTWFAPDVFHTLNLVFHLANVLLVFALLRRLVRSPLAAAAGAAIFGVHPLQAEPVAWVTGFNNLLGGSFCLGALLLWMDGGSDARSGGPTPRRYAAATALYLLALLSKPTSAALPLVVLVLDAAVLRRPVAATLRRLAPWAVLAAVAAVVTRVSADGTSAPVYLPLWGRPVVAGDALAFYAAKVFAPVRLCFDYGRTPARVLSHGWGYSTAAAAWGGAALLFLWRRRPAVRAVAVPAALFAAGAAPMLGFVPFYFQNISTVADRYAYLALLGPALAFATLLDGGPGGPPSRVRIAAAGVLLAVLGGLTFRQSQTWHTSGQLAARILSVNPHSGRAAYLLGLTSSDQGRTDEALGYYATAVREQPGNFEARYALGSLLARTGRPAEALPHLEAARAMRPEDADTRVNLGTAYLVLGRAAPAVAELSEAARLRPTDGFVLGQYGEALRRAHDARAVAVLSGAVAASPDLPLPHASLALALEERQRATAADLARARTEAERAIAAGPENAEAQYRVGLFYARLGERGRAADCLRAALRLDPAHGGARAALSSLGH
jgi:tetratricopeptide (TPR) repeat protein